MKNSSLLTLTAIGAYTSISSAATTTLISPTLNNGGFEVALSGTVLSGGSSGDGNSNAATDRFAANNGTIKVPGWTISTGGFSGLDGSQINDFTTPAPANGQDAAPNRGRGESRRVFLINDRVESTALSDDLTSGLGGDLFQLSLWTGSNDLGATHFTLDASIVFDAGLPSEQTVGFQSISHTISDAPNGQLADNVTNGFIERDNAAFGSVAAPADYSTAQLVLDVDNNNSNGANQSDQVYIDDVTLTVTSIPEPSSALLSLLALPFVLRRRR
ncbi:hypothetical protein [Roseibacillus persicicus]|uniref:hypothetical protein n=1 Tax=Roseibacillus persicicus TaxID=454148 RepID=UPI00280E5172|nr:hypothetical protein [Roseibacillus persicicus]MDQ8191973.1 hypothetical protein [Roseibacillus persicicus]